MSISKKDIYLFLVKAIIFLAFFDGIRSNLSFGKYITFIKLGITFCMLFFVLFNYPIKYKLVNKAVFPFYLYVAITIILSFLHCIFINSFTGIRVISQYFLFFIFIYIFQPLILIYRIKIGTILTFIIKIAVIYVIANWFLYFIELPIWNKFHPWFGRISQGYPTIDVFPLGISLAILMLYPELNLTKFKRWIYTLIVSIGLLGLVSGTGFVFICIIYFSALTILKYKKQHCNIIFNYKAIILPICLLIFSGLFILAQKEPNLYQNISKVAENRISILFNSNNIEYNTLDIRKEQFSEAKQKHIKDCIDQLFGVGVAYVNVNAGDINNNTIYIEDQYALNLITIGIIGNTFLFLFFFSLIYLILKNKSSPYPTKLMYSIFVLLFALLCKNVLPFNSFSALVIFSLCYIFILGDNKKYNKYVSH